MIAEHELIAMVAHSMWFFLNGKMSYRGGGGRNKGQNSTVGNGNIFIKEVIKVVQTWFFAYAAVSWTYSR